MFDNPNKDVKPVFKEIPGDGLNKQIAMLMNSIKTDNAGTNRLILLS
mgnify:CR=1 FL=1